MICDRFWAVASACLAFGSRSVCSTILTVGLLAIGAFMPPLGAQTQTSDFTGTVSDPSNAPIVNAKVTVTNEGTRAPRTVTTNEMGSFRVSGLVVGTYSLEVEAQGFKKYVQRGIEVSPGLVKRADVALEVGAVTETMSVTGAAPVLQTDSATLSTSLPAVTYSELPIANANRGAGYGGIFEQMQWAPGSAAGKAVYQFAGNRPEMMQTNIEGLQFNYISSGVPPSGIGETSAVISNAPAEYARPVTLNATLKSGTDSLHGLVVTDFTNACLDAVKTPFSQPQRAPCTTQWRYEYGVGGPVIIPKLYDGRGKTFFYFSLGRPKSSTIEQVANPSSVPTLAMQSGDFSQYPITINDPITGAPFPGNIIPTNRISQFAQGVVNDFYGSTVNYVGPANSFVNNRTALAGNAQHNLNWMTRIDQNIGLKDTLYGFFGWDRTVSNSSTLVPSHALFQAFNTGIGCSVYNFQIGISETHAFSSRVVNQFRGGYTRYHQEVTQVDANNLSGGPVFGDTFVSSWGLQGINAPHLSGMPQISIQNWNSTYNANDQVSLRGAYSAYDDLSIVKGNHTIKTGFSAIKLLQDAPISGPYFGSFTFSGEFTGEPFADFLLGLPNTSTRFSNRPSGHPRRWEFGAFVQDDFKITKRLTLNYGLRWDRFTVPYDKSGLYYNFDPKTFSIVVPDQHALDSISPAWPTATFPVVTASQAGFPSKLLNGTNSWQPRFGFAYNFRPGTVLRGGYGIYTAAVRFNELQLGGPFAVTENVINQQSSTSGTGALYAMPNPFPAAGIAPIASVTGFSLNYRPAYSQNWNLTLEHEIAPNWAIQVNYRGVKNTQLLWSQNLNAVPASTTPFTAGEQPFPTLGAIKLVRNGGNSYYDAAIFQVSHRWATGLYTTAAYTREWSGGLQQCIFCQDQSVYSPEYAFDLKRDYGPDPAYPTNDFIWNWVAELPVGRGHRFSGNANRWVNGIIGDWYLTGAFSWRSGTSFTPFLTGVDVGNIGNSGSRRPDVVPGCDPYGGARSIKGEWINTNCFTAPPDGQLGNAGVGSLVGPGAWQLNLNPYKQFPFTVHDFNAKIQVGASITNILNHPVYDNPSGIVNTPTGGQITATTWSRGVFNDFGNGQRRFIVDMRVIF
jgi:Carboxypeptidase regulatory-like domain